VKYEAKKKRDKTIETNSTGSNNYPTSSMNDTKLKTAYVFFTVR